jgi:ATP-binding cassette subfamily B protein
MARISEDVSRVRMYLGPAIMYSINLFFTCLLTIIYMFYINPKLAIFSLLPLPVLSVSIYFVNNLINRRSEEIQRSLSHLSTFAQESFSGIRILKAFAREDRFAEKFLEENEVYKNKSLKLNFVDSLFSPAILVLVGLSTILVVYVGGLEVMKGRISPGVIAEFIIYVNLLTWPVTSLGWVISMIQRAAASQTQVAQVVVWLMVDLQLPRVVLLSLMPRVVKVVRVEV